MAEHPLVRMVDLKKSYVVGDVTVHALRGVNLEIQAGTFLAVAIFGQLAAGVILDHFGLLGLEQHTLSFGRIAAVALILAGAVLMRIY